MRTLFIMMIQINMISCPKLMTQNQTNDESLWKFTQMNRVNVEFVQRTDRIKMVH